MNTMSSVAIEVNWYFQNRFVETNVIVPRNPWDSFEFLQQQAVFIATAKLFLEKLQPAGFYNYQVRTFVHPPSVDYKFLNQDFIFRGHSNDA